MLRGLVTGRQRTKTMLKSTFFKELSTFQENVLDRGAFFGVLFFFFFYFKHPDSLEMDVFFLKILFQAFYQK